jgi:hypothetical protein
MAVAETSIETLTRDHKKLFLANVGPVALKVAKQIARSECNPLTIRASDGSKPYPLRRAAIGATGRDRLNFM